VQFSGIVSHWRKINPISWFTTAFLLQVLLKNLDFTGYCSDILMCNGQFQKHFGWIYLFEILNTKISKSRQIFVCLVKNTLLLTKNSAYIGLQNTACMRLLLLQNAAW